MLEFSEHEAVPGHGEFLGHHVLEHHAEVDVEPASQQVVVEFPTVGYVGDERLGDHQAGVQHVHFE